MSCDLPYRRGRDHVTDINVMGLGLERLMSDNKVCFMSIAAHGRGWGGRG